MTLPSCMGSKILDSTVKAIRQYIEEDNYEQLEGIMSTHSVTPRDINRKNFIHTAAWKGKEKCVEVLLRYGANPNWPHRKNHCFPLHMAHFWMNESTSPANTIRYLVQAGSSLGQDSHATDVCNKSAVDHAVQHQRIDNLQVLFYFGAKATYNCMLCSLDVANPTIIKLLLLNNADTGKRIYGFYGPLLRKELQQKSINMETVSLLAEASIAQNVTRMTDTINTLIPYGYSVQVVVDIDQLLRQTTYHIKAAIYLYKMVLINGFAEPLEDARAQICHHRLCPLEDKYNANCPPLKDLAVKTIRRSLTYNKRNVLYGLRMLKIPPTLKDMIQLKHLSAILE